MDSQDNLQDLKKLIKKLFARWYVVALSLITAVSVAFLINRYTVPVYVIKASLFISESKDVNNSVSELLYGEDYLRASTNLTNHTILLKSFSHINNTINTLPYFNVFYYEEGNVLTKELYKSSPIEVRFKSRNSKVSDSDRMFLCSIIDEKTYKLTSQNGEVYNENYLFGKWYSFDSFDLRIIYKNHSKVKEIKFKINDINKLTKKYGKNLRINPVDRESSILMLALDGETPIREIDFLNHLVENYISQDLDQKNENAVKTIEFIDDQLSAIRDSLNEIEIRLERFKRENSNVNISSDNELFSSLRLLDIELSNLKVKDEYFNYLSEYITEEDFESNVIVPSIYGVDNSLINQLVQEFVQLQQEMKLIGNDSENVHPIISIKRKRIQELASNIKELIKNLKSSNFLSIKNVSKRIVIMEESLSKLPELERRYVNIQRMYDLSEGLYVFLMEKKAEAGIVRSSNISDAKLVDAAMVDGPPVKPQPLRNYFVAIFLGFAVPIIFILLFDYFNDKILYKEDLYQITDIPFLGMVGHDTNDVNMVVTNRPKSGVAESFRTIRSNIQYLSIDNQKQVFVVTSSVSGEGKTFCSINLAGVFSLSDKKTLLIGADLRKPKMYADFAVNKDLGLTNFLSGAAEIDDIIQKTSVSSLDIVTSGPVPPNPSELLMSDKMANFVNDLRSRYDYIIIDSPPVGLVTDALILMNYSDSGIYIVRQNYTSKILIENAQEMYNSGKIKNISILFNDVKVTKYGYSYGYGYGYGYGHGYYEEDNKNKENSILKRLFG